MARNDNWKYFPIWGLEIDEDADLQEPVFGDATIVSPAFVSKLSPSGEANTLLSGGGFKSVLEGRGLPTVGPAPIESRMELPPRAFVAVRRKDPEDAQSYADGIKALLSSTFVLTGQMVKGFSSDPRPMHWQVFPTLISQNNKGQTQCTYRVAAAPLLHLTPVRIDLAALRRSWSSGVPVTGSWTVSRESAMAAALVGPYVTITNLQRRVRDTAKTLARAMESDDPSHAILLAVVAMEELFRGKSTSFSEMEELASSIFSDSNGPGRVGALFARRHKVAHEGARLSSEDITQDILVAWIVLDLAARLGADGMKLEPFFEHLQSRLLASRLAKTLRSAGWKGLPEQLEIASTYPKAPPDQDASLAGNRK